MAYRKGTAFRARGGGGGRGRGGGRGGLGLQIAFYFLCYFLCLILRVFYSKSDVCKPNIGKDSAFTVFR